MFSCTVSFFGALPLGHQEQGSTGTALVHLCTLQSTDLSREIITSMQRCKLQAAICGIQQRERLSAQMDGQAREFYCIIFFFIEVGGMLHCSDVMFLIIAPTQQDEQNCAARCQTSLHGQFLTTSFPLSVVGTFTDQAGT